MDILNAISQYANLINLALLAIIIGWLLTLTQSYKENLTEKFESKLAEKDIEIRLLTERLSLTNEQLEFQKENSGQQLEISKNDLRRTEKWFERELATLQQKLSGTLDRAGITTESLVMSNDTPALMSEIRTTIVNVLKEIMVVESNRDIHKEMIDDPELFLALAKGFSFSHQWLEAAKNYDKYIRYFPDDWDVHFLRGVAYVNTRQGQDTNLAALRAYNEAIALMPVDSNRNVQARLFAYRGAVTKRLNRLAEAEADLLLAQKYATEDYEVYDIKYNLAAVYAMQGIRSKALEMVEELIGRPEIQNIRAHLTDYFSSLASDPEFREMIR